MLDWKKAEECWAVTAGSAVEAGFGQLEGSDQAQGMHPCDSDVHL